MESLTGQMQRHGRRLGEIQRALLPQQLPAVPGVTLAVSYEPDSFAGGDMYGVIPLPSPDNREEQALAVLIADVAGHGPAAAMVMAIVYGILHCYPRFTVYPSEVLGYLNEHLYQTGLPEVFVTALLGFYWPKSRTLRYCRAGHPEPLLRLASGQVQTLACPGTYPLGLFSDAHCEDNEAILPPGSLLMLYTDGITDTRSPTRAPFGVTSLERVLAASGLDPQAAVSEVHRAVCQHQGTAAQTDDRTILVLGIQ